MIPNLIGRDIYSWVCTCPHLVLTDLSVHWVSHSVHWLTAINVYTAVWKLKHACSLPRGPTRNVADVVLKETKWVHERDAAFFGQIIPQLHTTVSLPFCLSHCLSVSLNLFPSSSSSLCFALFLIITSSWNRVTKMNWNHTHTVEHTHTHTHTHSLHISTLRKSLHPLPISVSCFPHACSHLFVCGPALKGHPSVRRFLFSLSYRSRKCRAAGIFLSRLSQQQNTLSLTTGQGKLILSL